MKKLFFLTVFAVSSVTAFAQYGKLQPIKTGDTLMVVRTPQRVIDSLSQVTNATIRRQSGLIEHIELILEGRRKKFVNDSKISGYDGQIEGEIGILQREKFPDVRYYIREYMLYNPEYRAATR